MKKKLIIIGGLVLLVAIGSLFVLRNVLEVAEGGETSSFPLLKLINQCESGLVPVANSKESLIGGCALPMCDCGDICTRCGNGICGKGENSCNCPGDCERGQSESLPLPLPESHQSEDFTGKIVY